MQNRKACSFVILSFVVCCYMGCESSADTDIKDLKWKDEIQLSKLDGLKSNYLQGDEKNDDNYVNYTSYNFHDINYANIAPILERNCVFCHKPNGNAPFSLTNYEFVKKRSATIKEVIEKRIMPPWMADNSYSSFFNAPEITDEERAMIIQWVEADCQNNKPIKKPTEPKESNAISRKPDIVLRREKQHTITTNDDSYQCFVYDPGLKEDIYVSGVEFVSDNPDVIHHLMLYLDTSDVLVGKDCFDCKNDGIVNKLLSIQSWSRGMKPFTLNPALGYKIPKGSKFLLQTHYGDENHKGRKENTTLKFYLTDSTVQIIDYKVISNLDILYPANEIMTESIVYEVKDSLSIIGVYPHVHFLTKVIEVYAITPSKEQIPLLKIPRWDYLWQGQNIYDKPVIIPKGSTIYCNVLIDNTESNPTQPNNPVRDVTYNTNSNDEMLVLIIIEKDYKEGDENLQIAKFLK